LEETGAGSPNKEKPPSRGNSEVLIQYTYLYKRGKYEILLRFSYFEYVVCVMYLY